MRLRARVKEHRQYVCVYFATADVRHRASTRTFMGAAFHPDDDLRMAHMRFLGPLGTYLAARENVPTY